MRVILSHKRQTSRHTECIDPINPNDVASIPFAYLLRRTPPYRSGGHPAFRAIRACNRPKDNPHITMNLDLCTGAGSQRAQFRLMPVPTLPMKYHHAQAQPHKISDRTEVEFSGCNPHGCFGIYRLVFSRHYKIGCYRTKWNIPTTEIDEDWIFTML